MRTTGDSTAGRFVPQARSGVRRSGTALVAAGLLMVGTATLPAAPAAPVASTRQATNCRNGDLNGDGTGDVVIGSPGRSGVAGSVELRLSRGQEFDPVRVAAPSGALGFGSAVAVLYDNGSCTDVAVGAPDQTVDGSARAGVVYVYRWDGRALTLHQTASPGHGLGGKAEAGARFGAAIASITTGVYIGAPGSTVKKTVGAGIVYRAVIGSGGLETSSEGPISYGSPQLPTAPSANAGFGSVIAGSVAQDDILIGAPGQSVAGVVGAGEMIEIFPDYDGEKPGPKRFNQATATVPGVPERNDHFGAALAIATFRPGTVSDYLIGVPGEDVGKVTDAGSVVILTYSMDADRLSTARAYDQTTKGVAGTAEKGDAFGASVSIINRPRLLPATYLVGVPGEDVGTVKDAGMVQTVAGSPNGSWTQSTHLVPGSPEAGDRFGARLVGSLVGVPGEDNGTGGVLRGLPDLTTRSDYWHPSQTVVGGGYGTSLYRSDVA